MIIRLFILLIIAASLVAGGYFAVQELYIKPEQRLLADKKRPAPTPPPDPSVIEFERCVALRATSSPAEVRAAFERLLKEFPNTKMRGAALDVIGEINSSEFFSQKPAAKNTYVVQPGDSLSRISARTRLPLELIIHLNQLTSDRLQPGQQFITPDCDFRVTLDQKARLVTLTNHGSFFRQYHASVWPGMHKSPPIFLPATSGKVIDKSAFKGGSPVKPSDPDYFSGVHIVNINIPGHSLYSQPADPSTPVTRPQGGGIGLPPDLMREIAVLLPRGTPVTLE